MADNDIESTPAMAKAKELKATAKAKAKEARAAEKAKAKGEKDRVKSLAQMAQDNILKELKASLEVHARSATFACGGSVGFKLTDDIIQAVGEEDTVEERAMVCKIDPIQIRSGESGKGITVTLPAINGPSKELLELISACQPATFGRGNQEVLDEAYRKAGKLDKTAFATTSCPSEAGIIDAAAQLLVSQTVHEKDVHSIKAELYRLNVYSAPSGKFKPHVHTPRSKDQIGNLVVALPVDHEGGALVIRNAGKELVFDWSVLPKDDGTEEAREPAVNWAAFYSDCEHEVYEVMSRNRITLTYNLYIIRGLGHLAGAAPMLDPISLPLYARLQNALDNPGFLRRGRVLAIWLTHSYAHTNKHVNFLPSSLKSADMSLYETARALGLMCMVVSVMTLGGYYDEGPRHLVRNNSYGFNEGQSHNGAMIDESEPGWGAEMPESKVTWLNPPTEADNDDKQTKKEKRKKQF